MDSVLNSITNYINWLQSCGISHNNSILIKELTVFVALFFLVWLFDYILRKVVMRVLVAAAKKTTTEWDDVLIENRVIKRILHTIPAFLLHQSIAQIFTENSKLIGFMESGIEIYAILMVILTFTALFKSINQIYLTYPAAKERSIKGYLQVGSIIVYFVGGIAILSVLIGKSVAILLGGLGAFAAVLMLVFKDSILGLVGGIQLSSNDMLRPGDWITMPSHGADGLVKEIGLTIVKVQNFDKTIVTIPTYTLVSNSFQNWRGMESSGTRRFKRFINIDLTSIKFCDSDFLSKISTIEIFKDTLLQNPFEPGKSTNIEVFRVYAMEYLKRNPLIAQDLTILAKQNQPTDFGLPIEIVAFSTIQSNLEYEDIQAKVIEHLIAILPMFELRIYQRLSGLDMRK